MAAISGFGQDGPLSQSAPAFDQIAQGHGRADVRSTGAPGPKARCGSAIPVARPHRRPVSCAMGILTALLEARGCPARGQWVQTSLLQAQIFMLDFQARAPGLMEKDVAKAGRQQPPRPASRPARSRPPTATSISATAGGRIWERCAQTLGAPRVHYRLQLRRRRRARLEENRRRAQRRDHQADRNKIHRDLGQRAQMPPGVPCGPIYADRPRCSRTPQVKHLGIAQDVPNEDDRDNPVSSPSPSRCRARPKQDGRARPAGVRRADRGGAGRVRFWAQDEIATLRQAKVV